MSRYSYEYRRLIPQYDCDPLLRLRPAAALRYMQQSNTEQLESLGMPHQKLYEEGIVFVLASQAIKYYRSPRCHEEVLVQTSPVGAKGAQFLRETVVSDPKGEVLIEGQSAWAIINPVDGRVKRPSAFRHSLPLLERWEPFCDPSRIHIRPATESAGERKVRLSDIDLNLHMNNTVYADIVLDCFSSEILEQKREVSELFLKYRAQARVNEMLSLKTGKDGGFFLVEADLAGKTCLEAAISFR